MARSEGTKGPAQHLAAAIAAAFARAEQPGEHLAVHAPKLAVKPRLQILRRHRRSLLLRLEHPHRPAVQDHVNRASRLGLHRSIILRIGIKELHHLVDEKLAEYQRSGQPPWAAICRFQPGDRALRFDPFPTAISLQTIRNALNYSGFRKQKGVRSKRAKGLA